ncbi:hypothetical protein [Dyella acidiphila]|uniref:Glycosyltransferase RgtA/B/C/D-like domain-containing protein n=1 Tax=Dyella acidiphila TaxID=2775866 RepID=A0ABR9GBR5_9GAMM|nr:hypothetical protein [Dyella acidiphila]MBE1161466.1 hypothetical protein [Dyella acidiphila]
MNAGASGRHSLGRLLQLLCLVLILSVGLLLRLGTAWGTQVDAPVRNDARDYVAYAWNVQTYGVYSLDASTFMDRSPAAPRPDAIRPPGYPLLLQALMPKQLSPAFIARVCYVQGWIAEATLLCSVLLAMELVGAWPGLLLGALVVLSPHQSVYVGYLLTETFYGFALMLALAAAVLALKSARGWPRWSYACACGMLFGLSCLIRPTLNQWVPVLVLLMLVWRPLRQYRREIALLAFGFVLAMSPWWIRNEITLHRLSDAEKMIDTLHDGSYPGFMYEGRRETFGYPNRFDPNTALATASWPGIYHDLASKFAKAPLAMLHWYLIGKVVYFFNWSADQGWGDIFVYPLLRSPWLWNPMFLGARAVIRAIYAPLIIGGVLGMLFAFLPRTAALFAPRQTQGIRFLALLQLFAIGVHVVGAPFSRYSVPFRPLTFLLAVFLFVWLYRYFLQVLREREAARVVTAND